MVRGVDIADRIGPHYLAKCNGCDVGFCFVDPAPHGRIKRHICDLDAKLAGSGSCGICVFHRKDISRERTRFGSRDQLCLAIGGHGLVLVESDDGLAAWRRGRRVSSGLMARYGVTERGIDVQLAGLRLVCRRWSSDCCGRAARREIWFTDHASFDYDPNGTYAIEHAYVQYFVPVNRNALPPVVLMHGGGLTGVTWETTPDGRPGWLQGLVHRGFEVHVVDGVERGRAGWCAVDGVWPDQAVQRTLEEAWVLFRLGTRDGFAVRKGFEGQRFPIDFLEQFARRFVPRWTSTTAAAIAAFSAVLEHVGQAIVICHSQGGQIAFNAGAQAPERVAAMVAIEPSGFSDDTRAWRDKPIAMIYGDYQDAKTGGPNLLTAGRAWAQGALPAGARVDLVHLPDTGIFGNSHMLMMDDNSDTVLDLITAWLARVTGSDHVSPAPD